MTVDLNRRDAKGLRDFEESARLCPVSHKDICDTKNDHARHKNVDGNYRSGDGK